jgi:hypothetical protein
MMTKVKNLVNPNAAAYLVDVVVLVDPLTNRRGGKALHVNAGETMYDFSRAVQKKCQRKSRRPPFCDLGLGPHDSRHSVEQQLAGSQAHASKVVFYEQHADPPVDLRYVGPFHFIRSCCHSHILTACLCIYAVSAYNSFFYF